MKSSIRIEKLNVAYGKHPVLKGISAEIPQGKLTAILGENGSGKSTLLNTLFRLNSISGGTIELLGKNLNTYTHRELAQALSMVSQQTEIVPFTVYEYMMMGRTPYRNLYSLKDSQEDKETVDSVISRLGLEKLKDKPLSKLSGGERQLATIARAIVQNTPIILLDEPTANLDIRHQEEIMRTLQREITEQGKTIVMVMHDINLAARYAEYVIMIKNGNIIQQGMAADILNSRNLSELYQINLTEITDNNCTLFLPK